MVVVVPTYQETDSLKKFVFELLSDVNAQSSIVIADDSGLEFRSFLLELVNELKERFSNEIIFSFSERKSGRGSAVLRGLNLARDTYPGVQYFLECDADGSHRPTDIMKCLQSCYENPQRIIVGSRYLESSQILGWPLSRKIFSKVLNSIIPKILNVELSDITNGLRIYPKSAVDQLLANQFATTSFVNLSESALFLKNQGYSFHEVPTIFVDRTIGKSTVTPREVYLSIVGLAKILFKRLHLERSSTVRNK